jgi:hypothetical protein
MTWSKLRRPTCAEHQQGRQGSLGCTSVTLQISHYFPDLELSILQFENKDINALVGKCLRNLPAFIAHR